MNIEKEGYELKAIVDSEVTAIGLLQALNRALLSGVEPSEIIEKLSYLEMAERLKFRKFNT